MRRCASVTSLMTHDQVSAQPACLANGDFASQSRHVTIGAFFAAAIVVLVYWPARHNGFIWDDLSYLVYSPAFRDPAQWTEALFQPPTGQAVFRPLALLSFALPLWLGLTDPAPHHIVNVLIHAASVVLLTLLAWRIFRAEFASGNAAALCASLTGLVYGLHPALTESVLWIACRFDLMMTFFLLLVLLADRKFTEGGWTRAAMMGLLFLCALLSKETAVGFMLALPFVHLAVEPASGGPLRLRAAAGILARHGKVYVGLFVACAVYAGLRYGVLGSSLGLTRVMSRFDEIGSILQRGIVVAASLTEYISDALWPSFNVPPNRVLVIPVDEAVRIVPALAGAGGVAVLAFGAAFHAVRARVPGLFVIAFLAALLPVSNVVPAPTYPGELQIAARYLTFPMVFICLGLCALAPALSAGQAVHKWSRQMLAGLLVVAWLAGSTVIVRTVTPLWHDEAVFFRWAIALAPPNSLPYLYINLGSHYANHHDMAQARDAFAQAVEAKPRSQAVASLAWYNLGNAEDKLGNADGAKAVLRGALVIDPDNVFARASLARLERMAGRANAAAAVADEGLQRFRRAGIAHPNEAMLHYQLGMAYIDLKSFDAAVEALDSAVDGARSPQARADAEQALAIARRAGR